MLELGRQGRLFIAPNTVIMKRAALLAAGKFVPELRGASDWFADYVAGFRHGICFVPEPLAIAQIQPDGYWRRIRQDRASYRAALEELMRLLNQPSYHDAAEMIREAGSLYIHGVPMLKVVLSRPEYRPFLIPALVRKCIWHSTQVFLKRFTPAILGNLYFRVAGYRACTSRPVAAASQQ